MTDLNTPEEPETLTKAQVFSFCRHLGRSLKTAGVGDTTLALRLLHESTHLEKNGFEDAAEMFAVVADTLDPNLPKKPTSNSFS